MFGLIIALHVLVCALLIVLVLVQQGRGGGLIESLSSAENIFGTKTSTFLVKATSVLAVIFFFTCLSLAFLSIRKGKSLLETNYWKTKQQTAAPAAPASSTDTKSQAPAAPTNATAAPASTTATQTAAASAPAAPAQTAQQSHTPVENQ